MIPFYSKRNQVYPCIREGRCVVEKHFAHMSDWDREVAAYDCITGLVPVPAVVQRTPGMIATEYLPYPSLLFVLEQQERCGFSPEPWVALVNWIDTCKREGGILPSDANLRNFLWNAQENTVYGLDLESYAPVSIEDCGAMLTAMLLTYDPMDTPVKQAAAEVIVAGLTLDEERITLARRSILNRRSNRNSKELSGIILAGGQSRRMGCNKSELCLLGKTMLEWQIEKMRSLGISDIMVSGVSQITLPEVRVIPDELTNRGPLGGLHACLGKAKNPMCLVLSVDTPLVPLNALSHLIRSHKSGVTTLFHAAGEEPLIGVYDREVHHAVYDLIRTSGAPVCLLKSIVTWNSFDYLGPEELLSNCNTPDEYTFVCSVANQFSKFGIKL